MNHILMHKPDSDSESDSNASGSSDDNQTIDFYPKDNIVEETSENHPTQLQLDKFVDFYKHVIPSLIIYFS